MSLVLLLAYAAFEDWKALIEGVSHWAERRYGNFQHAVAFNMIRQKLVNLTEDPQAGIFMSISRNLRGSVYLNESELQAYRAEHARLVQQQQADGVHAEKEKRKRITSKYSSTDFISLVSFE
ncbi:hypothetical protein GQ44DRAFT_832289 [Phaeosphaeriaceae sp. PMI808]|nr:hypothetical protein GQ44DRAFT_832289 [Phaeosphaeriaceae sp. PMI808]